jgi:outer membrane biosynthesis protein TonB
MVYLKRMAISFAVLFFLMVVAGSAVTALNIADSAGSGYEAPQMVPQQPMIQEPPSETSVQEPSEPANPESYDGAQPEETPQTEEIPPHEESPDAEEQMPDIPPEEPEEPVPETESSYSTKGNGKGKSNLSPGFLRNLFKKSK